MTTPLYDLLEDRTSTFIGPLHWLGNLRWFAEETTKEGSFVFRTSPADASEAEHPWPGSEGIGARRTLFGLKINDAGNLRECIYKVDGVTAIFEHATFSLSLPLENFGALISLQRTGSSNASLQIIPSDLAGRRSIGKQNFQSTLSSNQFLWKDGRYSLSFYFSGDATPDPDGSFSLRPDAAGILQLAASFHLEDPLASAEAVTLFHKRDEMLKKSQVDWNDYLQSCPVADFEQDYTCTDARGTVTYPKHEIRVRQYWHWHSLLANVYQIPFNTLSAYIAPDKSAWYGVWSNDGPESLRALLRTNRHALARECILGYIRTALSEKGDLAWYLHGTGEPCLGKSGDSGRLSHGVPTILTTVAEYVDVTGDSSLLDEPAGGGLTVWEKLKCYLTTVFQNRDINGDGLVEWVHLWEGGADDKVGCFFSAAPLEAWAEAVTTLPETELRDFYKENSRPVVNLYEQAFFLKALDSMKKLAIVCNDKTTLQTAHERKERIIHVLEERHWNDEDGFYYDWNVKDQTLTRTKNQDAFYLLSYLPKSERTDRVVSHLNNRGEFALPFIPTLAADAPGFRANGYWCGGYWPRESYYIAHALWTAGYPGQALATVIKALCSEKGKIIRENMNPLDGKTNTPICNMAYNVLLNLVLKQILDSPTS